MEPGCGRAGLQRTPPEFTSTPEGAGAGGRTGRLSTANQRSRNRPARPPTVLRSNGPGGIDPDYYLAIDSSSDLPYDVYRAGEGRIPIYLQMPSGEEKELSTYSVIVESITGKTREDHKMYFPIEKIKMIQDSKLKQEIYELLNYR